MKKLLSILILLLCICLLLEPTLCYEGSKNGCNLWISTILPSLIPFCILSNFILRANLISPISDMLYPLLHPLLGVSKNGCFAVLIGILSGLPTGAKTCADLVERKLISVEEGQYLLSFTNNASPMFLTIYLAEHTLHCPSLKFPLYFIILLSSLLCSIVYRFFSSIFSFHTSHLAFNSISKQETSNYSLGLIINQSIFQAFQTLLYIGGYVIIFSIFSTIILHTFSHIPGFLYGILSLMEMTTAMQLIGCAPLALNTKIILTTTCAGFGGLSGLFQTYSVISGTGLSFSRYICTKSLQTALVFLEILLFQRQFPFFT